MEDLIHILFWFFLTYSMCVMAFFIYQSLRIKVNAKQDARDGIFLNCRSDLSSLLYLCLVSIGWFSIISIGVFSILKWLPDSADELRGTIACIAAFLSINVLEQLDRAAAMRQELAIIRGTLIWIKDQFHHSRVLSSLDIANLDEKSKNNDLPYIDNRIALFSRDLAKLLLERDKKIEKHIIENLQSREN